MPEVRSDLPTQKELAEKPEEVDGEGERSSSPSQENFADFSKFDNFVKAQASSSATQVKSRADSPVSRAHRRSFSLDYAQVSPLQSVHQSIIQPTKPTNNQIIRKLAGQSTRLLFDQSVQ